MSEPFNLEQYLSDGVEEIVKKIKRASLSNPKESLFLVKYGLASKKASVLRSVAEDYGEHVPPFLIASITSECNLHCTGCYARANHVCSDGEGAGQLSDQEWRRVFREASELGISFILLAGGEPLMRRRVIEEAGKVPEIIFPIFTNATLIDADYIKLFDRCRNLIPVLSIEGEEIKTDERRGSGVYDRVMQSAGILKENGILFGASVTVTTANIRNVTSRPFLDELYRKGCKAVFYVEYIPAAEGTADLAPGSEERTYLQERLQEIRSIFKDIILISFPGDEQHSQGCLAAGRGFFHINPHGDAEACPFSPYSDSNVRKTSLRQALRSKLFRSLREEHYLEEDHGGGCVLFEQREKVRLLAQNGE